MSVGKRYTLRCDCAVFLTFRVIVMLLDAEEEGSSVLLNPRNSNRTNTASCPELICSITAVSLQSRDTAGSSLVGLLRFAKRRYWTDTVPFLALHWAFQTFLAPISI
jgi:hypothetical protein